ncbi:MAG TPA: DEAD/DEAH box helicase [Acidimicrobiales bacterium]|nr:DEAD/DEAH box helicase [Acidimicrobiales bacterium]
MTNDGPDTFAALGLRPELLEALTRLGYEEPTPIQQATIPALLEGKDLVGQAATGTGKTAAFALPAIERLMVGRDRSSGGGPSVLVLLPTRELAMQVSEAVHAYGRDLGVDVLPLYGGQPMGRQLKALRRSIDVVVATPGRALDHLHRGSLQLEHLQVAILDEADEMLDMGFAEDIESILDATPSTRQTVLFSATMPARIESIARKYLRDSVRITIDAAPTPEGHDAKVRETAYIVRRSDKTAALGRILDIEAPTAALVFCRTRVDVEELTEKLNGHGYQAEALHGGMDQSQRDRVMQRVRTGAADLLVATDVAARGLDIDVLTHVVNFDVPSAPGSYVHRIGRVGRAGRDGVAITLVDPREHRSLKNVERMTRRRMEVAQVPTVQDLRSRRMERTMEAVRTELTSDELDRFRPIVDTLADDYDAVEIALAALKLAHEATVGSSDGERDIPPAHLASDRPKRDRTGRSGPSRQSGRDDRGPRRDRDDRRSKSGGRDMTRLYVAAGYAGGVKPGDLVGAIAGETSLSGKDIGHIEITNNFSLVEVPSDTVDEVISAMKRTTIKGKRTTFRREKFTSR